MDRILEQQQQQHENNDSTSSSPALIHQQPRANSLTESSLLRWSRIHSMNGIVPPPRSGAASVVACGKLFVFGGYGGGTGRLDDFWSFDFATTCWNKVQVKSQARPGCRENNGVVISGNTATIFLFGGYNGSAWLNDLWEFNIETSCWTCIQESSDASSGPEQQQGDISAVGNANNNGNGSNRKIVPSRRFGYVSVVHKGKLILWGGFDGSRWLNDMYVFDFEQKSWTEIPQNNTDNGQQVIPSVRSCPAWAKDDNYVYIQGGYDGVERKSDFFACDLNTYTWTQMPSSRGTPPSPRYFHSCCLSRGGGSSSSSDASGSCSSLSDSNDGCGVNKNKLYLYGGYSGAERLADMYVYEFETQHWSRVDCTAGDAPSGRSSLVAQAHEGSLWCFGGYNGSTVLNDFYKFRLSAIVVPPTRLVTDFRRLLHSASDFASDVTFRVDDKLVHAHRAILAIRSEYFRVLLCGGYMRESSSPQQQHQQHDVDMDDNEDQDDTSSKATTTAKCTTLARSNDTSTSSTTTGGEIEIQDVSYEVFLKVLEFLYTDTICELTSSCPSTSSLEMGIHLLIASERFMLDRLKALCEDVIRKQVHVDNVMAILVASHVYNAKSLKDLTLDFILRHLQHPAIMAGLSDLRSEPDLLLEIIKRNSGNSTYNNNQGNNPHPHQYHSYHHSQPQQQQQYDGYNNNNNNNDSAALSLAAIRRAAGPNPQHYHAHHLDAASAAANAGAGGAVAAAAAAAASRNGGNNDNFDYGLRGGGDARQQNQEYGGPFGNDWRARR